VPLKVPDAIEVEVLTTMLTPDLTMRLYSNDKTPANGDTVAAYTEISGGGYLNKPLVFAEWDISGGTPSAAVYDSPQVWIFTGPLDAPNTIYGYFVTRDTDGKLMWAERFPSANVPFSPINGSKIQVLPRITAESQF
jgi:hypothetical protein